MATRPDTAKSEISSAISDDGSPSRLPPAPPSDRARSTTPGALSINGYSHFRGVTNPSNTLRGTGPGSTFSGASRPQSPDSIASRTHIPSLTAQGFLRPMSSSRLQQQRLQNLRAAREERERSRPTTGAGAPSTQDDDDAHSIHSNRTGPFVSLPRQHRPTASVTTGYTDSEAPETYDNVSHAAHSEADQNFLRNNIKTKKGYPAPLDLSNARDLASPNGNSLRSPHSFISRFSIGSKQIAPSNHQHLPSHEPSPRYENTQNPHNLQEKQLIAQQDSLGKNYEYFEGNTVFWMGGRIQNARDRPFNILTGVLIVLPTILFFVFS